MVWKGMNDLHQTRFDGQQLQTEGINRMYETYIGFIRKCVEKSTAAHIVAITHHLPTFG